MLETSVISYRNLTPEQKEILFRNIPDRVKDIPGWSVTRLIGPQQKAPIHPHTGKLVDPTNKSQGTTFHNCWCSVVDGFYDALGFTFQTEYGMTVLDMDNKEQNAEVQFRIDTISQAYIAAGHYTEDSQSFLGKHIVVEGTLPEGKGRRRGNYETYCNARFMIFTGRGSGLIMPDRVGTIMEAYNQMDDDRASNVEFDDSITDIRTVDQIRNLVRGMANGVRVRYMIEVGYNPGDRSAQDAELAEAIFFHTLDHRLARRVFESAACWDAERIAEKNRKRGGKAEEYLEMTLKFAYSQVQARREVQRQAAEEAKMNVQRAIEIQAKAKEVEEVAKSQPQDIDFPMDAGAMTAMYMHARYNAPKNFPEGAALSAIVHAGAIIARGFVGPTGLGTNLYGVVVAYSGWGKEGCITEVRDLIDSAGTSDGGGLIQLSKMLSGDFGSAESLRESIAENRILCLWHHEFGKMLKSALKSNSNQYKSAVFDLMTRVFTLSGENKKLHEYSVRDSKKVIAEVYRPCLSFIGETTPTDFTDLNLDAFTDGTIARYVFARAKERPPYNDQPYQEFYAQHHVRTLYNTVLSTVVKNTPTGSFVEGYYKVPETPDAMIYRIQRRQFIDEQSDKYQKSNPVLAACLNRYMENTIKIATIYAVCRNPEQPMVQAADYQWATKFIDDNMMNIVQMIDHGELGGVDDGARVERIKEILKNWAFSKDSARLKPAFSKYKDHPYLFPYSYVTQYAGKKHFPDRRDITRIMMDLERQGVIAKYVNPTAEQIAKNPDMLSVKGDGYIITDPASL
jgi:hypothetical protein